MKNLSMIACISQDLGIGYRGKLLWSFKPDMQFFRDTTMHHPVVMGARTFNSIGKILPGRENIILSHEPLEVAGARVFHDRDALDQYLDTLPGEKFIIGGAMLYKSYLDLVDKLYLTEVAATKPADTFFPTFDRNKFTRKILQQGELDGIQYTMSEYTRAA